ncbi:hypothetical protein LTR94_034416, partial [Friedmanniomyces endolithicus]
GAVLKLGAGAATGGLGLDGAFTHLVAVGRSLARFLTTGGQKNHDGDGDGRPEDTGRQNEVLSRSSLEAQRSASPGVPDRDFRRERKKLRSISAAGSAMTPLSVRGRQ